MDSVAQSQAAGAGSGILLALGVWALAVVAAVIATLQRHQAVKQLREQLAELERKVTPPVAAPTPTRTGPSFGATFYQESPSPLAGAFAWPGALPTLLAAVLAVAGAALLLMSARGDRSGEARLAADVSQLKASHDSLLIAVTSLRDTVRLAAQEGPSSTSPARPQPDASPIKRVTTASREARSSRKSAITPAPAIPPAPVLP